MNDKILKRARALLAMSQDASSENEAMIALKRLHALLAQHNMSVLDLEDKSEAVGQDCFESTRWPWKGWVTMGVAKLYFCETYIASTRKNYCNYYIVGTDFNREFALSIIQNIFRIIEAEARVESKNWHGRVVSSFVSSFHKGAGARIQERCKELIQSAKKGELVDDENRKLPVMLNLYKQHENNNEEFMSLNLDLKTLNTSTRDSDPNGYSAGKKAGDRVQLSRGIQSKSATKLIGN